MTALGSAIAAKDGDLCYGGGDMGCMGLLARAVLAGGGGVTGVIPSFMLTPGGKFAGGLHGATVEVKDMHERKLKMLEMADAVVACPGGIGTLEELTELLSWVVLGVTNVSIGLLDVEGYWTPFVALLRHMVDAGFMKERFMDAFVIAPTAEELLAKLDVHKAPEALLPASAYETFHDKATKADV